MITGLVTGDEARVCLKIKGSRRRTREIEVIIDTGYTTSLTLPPSLVKSLGLNWRSVDRGTLADGSECLFDVYEAVVVWDGQQLPILVDEVDGDPLIGMRLLHGYELNLQVRPRGKVTIKRLRAAN